MFLEPGDHHLTYLMMVSIMLSKPRPDLSHQQEIYHSYNILLNVVGCRQCCKEIRKDREESLQALVITIVQSRQTKEIDRIGVYGGSFLQNHEWRVLWWIVRVDTREQRMLIDNGILILLL